MRRRFNQKILVTKAPQNWERKKYKYEKKMRPFNIWFREQLEKTGGFKKFLKATKISYNTARCWTYKTEPQVFYRYKIVKYFGAERGINYLTVLAELENVRLSDSIIWKDKREKNY